MLTMLWQQIPNTTITELLCSTKMQAIVLDCEHGYFNNETLVDCIRVIKLYKKKAFVRLKYNEQLIQLAVDNGIDGIIYANAKDNINYLPGTALVRKNLWGNKKVIPANDTKIIQIAQIECVESIESIPYLYDVEPWAHKFDYYMIGKYDLKVSCDKSYMADHEDDDSINYSSVDYQIKKLESEIENKKKMAIHLVKNIDKDIDKYKDYGCIAFGLDTLAIIDKIKELNKYV